VGCASSPVGAQRCNRRSTSVECEVTASAYSRAAQAYMLISMPTGTSTIFGVFQAISTLLLRATTGQYARQNRSTDETVQADIVCTVQGIAPTNSVDCWNTQHSGQARCRPENPRLPEQVTSACTWSPGDRDQAYQGWMTGAENLPEGTPRRCSCRRTTEWAVVAAGSSRES
jgi:hypothetical protein